MWGCPGSSGEALLEWILDAELLDVGSLPAKQHGASSESPHDLINSV